VMEALEREVAEHGGIRREFVFSRASGAADELILIVMAWGFGTTSVRWPRQAAMLTSHDHRDRVSAIIERTRAQGASAGWSALWGKEHVNGLGASFGTKLLYFSAYRDAQPQRPLIFDANAGGRSAPGRRPGPGFQLPESGLRRLLVPGRGLGIRSWLGRQSRGGGNALFKQSSELGRVSCRKPACRVGQLAGLQRAGDLAYPFHVPAVYVRHEALFVRMEVEDLDLPAVVAAG
jgi:hypothetical protein